MLMQNWFYQPNMEKFFEYYDEQWFFDKNSKAIYYLSEDKGQLVIREITMDDPDYKIFYDKYLKFKSKDMPIDLFVEEVKRFFCCCSDNELSEVEESTIDISMCGFTTKIPWSSHAFKKIIGTLTEYTNEMELRCETIDEQILRTLTAYYMTNREILSDVENRNLEDQIAYMKDKIRKDG